MGLSSQPKTESYARFTIARTWTQALERASYSPSQERQFILSRFQSRGLIGFFPLNPCRRLFKTRTDLTGTAALSMLTGTCFISPATESVHCSFLSEVLVSGRISRSVRTSTDY